jgi:hypothetical protein
LSPKYEFNYKKEIGKLIVNDLDSCCNHEFDALWDGGIDVEYEHIWDSFTSWDVTVERIETGVNRLKWLQISLNGYPCYLFEKYNRHDDAAYHFKSYTMEPEDIFDPRPESYEEHRKRFNNYLSWIKEGDIDPDFCVVRRKDEPGPVIYSMRSIRDNFTLSQGFKSVAALRHCFENVVKPRL